MTPPTEPEPSVPATTEAERQERSDRVYAQYSSAMRFFGEVPAPQAPVIKDGNAKDPV